MEEYALTGKLAENGAYGNGSSRIFIIRVRPSSISPYL